MLDHELESIGLTDQELARKLRVYDPTGQLADRLKLIWDRVGDELLGFVRQNFADALAAGTITPPPGFSHDRIVARTVELWEMMLTRGLCSTDLRYFAGSALSRLQNGEDCVGVALLNTRIVAQMCSLVGTRFADDLPFVAASCESLTTINAAYYDTVFTVVGAFSRAAEHKGLADESEAFRSDISTSLTRALDGSRGLRERTGQTSQSARGMLGKTSEVAAAAEQSALAMREAAHTAAGLIRAIEESRAEVEVAAQIATRAADRSGHAVAISGVLSDHAQAIESILGLIRDIAGQTNLLALNATIEAARAGDAGRGFAVVAQEVKSLASQTARATDDIAAKIAAIQAATRQTVEANGAIRDIVGEVQSSAERIRSTMEAQAQTVTMITAAVDETALAADSMSTTISAIRSDTEGVAGEIDHLEAGFRRVDDELSKLETITGDFVSKIAA